MNYIDDLEHPQVSAGDASTAAGIDRVTFKNWLSRKPAVILLHKEEKVDFGDRVFLKLRLSSVIHLAIVAEMAALGVPPSRAHEIAMKFTYSGNPGRLPGQIFVDGDTYLVAGKIKSFVFNVDLTQGSNDVVGRAEKYEAGPLLAMNVTKIVWRVRASLGLPARPSEPAKAAPKRIKIRERA